MHSTEIRPPQDHNPCQPNLGGRFVLLLVDLSAFFDTIHPSLLLDSFHILDFMVLFSAGFLIYVICNSMLE